MVFYYPWTGPPIKKAKNKNSRIIIGNISASIPHNRVVLNDSFCFHRFMRYFRCYYPEVFSFKLEGNETVSLIDEDKVYVEAWIEEGWDEKLGCASENYKYYSKILVKDFEGNVLSEEIGQLYQDNDGTWWIS